MSDPIVNAFILYNEQERDQLEVIVKNIENEGLTTFFWSRDVSYGSAVDEMEQKQYKAAPVVVVFLGNAGWGPNHLRIANDAQKNKKVIIPVLIGEPPADALLQVNNLFRDNRYFDLRKSDEKTYKRLADAIKSATAPEQNTNTEQTKNYDSLINTLIKGPETNRNDVLQLIKISTSIDRSQLSLEIRSKITELSRDANVNEKDLSELNAVLFMALILADVEAAENRTFILDFLYKSKADSSDSSSNAVYWILAYLYKCNASYIIEAIQPFLNLSLPPLVSTLSYAIKDHLNPDLIDSFKGRLNESDFKHDQWPVIRALRVVPIPALTEELCSRISDRTNLFKLPFEVLSALALPDIASEAARILTISPGIETIVRLMIKETKEHAEDDVARNFPGLLAAFDEQKTDLLLGEAIKDPITGEAALLLRKYLLEFRRSDDESPLFVAGYSSDSVDVEEDLLGIAEDVKTLTAIMLAKDVKPPLAIGLFGNWGSGKSFFMQSMEAEAMKLSKRKKAAFCEHIVHIRFNAWNYIDTNLWASLVSYILEKLSAYVSPPLTADQQQANLLTELGSAKQIVDQAKLEIKNSRDLIQDRKTALREVQATRENKQIELRDLKYKDILALLPEKKKIEIEAMLKSIGIPVALSSLDDLNTVISEGLSIKGRFSALFFSIVNSRDRSFLVIGLLILLVLVPLGVWALLRNNVHAVVMAITAFIAEAVAGITAVTAVLRKGFSKMKAVYDSVDSAKRTVEIELAKKRMNPTPQELALEKEIAILNSREQEELVRLAAANTRIFELEERIRSISEGQSLARFLTERTLSDDYKKHMGLISTIRNDFEKLGERLKTITLINGVPPTPVERIILYIDDLDRCPTDKVMDVLQAVHLLLAYPLFVVVVGVDPRWLVHSLGYTLDAFNSKGDQKTVDSELLYATPQNYLEKIFQIPFSIRPMTDDGFGKLMDQLLVPAVKKVTKKEHKNNNGQTTRGNEDKNKISTDDHAQNNTTDNDKTDNNRKEDEKNEETSHIDSGNTDNGFEIYEDALTIKPWESAFAQSLFPLIPTPRAAKRFSNVYRILKAPVGGEYLHQFEGTDDFPGDFQVPMLLLSILIGSPNEAASLFLNLQQYLIEKKHLPEALNNLSAIGLSAPPFFKLQEKIIPIVSSDKFPLSPKLFLYWIPKVSRFSFELGHIVPPLTRGVGNRKLVH